MRSTGQSSVATMLLLVPILAIPMLAIFGIPQFAPAVSRLPSDSDPFVMGNGRGGDAPAFSATQPWSEEFSPAASRDVASSGTVWADDVPRQSNWTQAESTSAPVATASGQAASARGVQTADRNPPEMAAPPVVVPTVFHGSVTPLTWKSAVSRLNQLEIRNFRLEPGQQAGQFLFVCSYTPQHNPRLSYRFEAEADEPLKAVEKVLSQIDQWMASR